MGIYAQGAGDNPDAPWGPLNEDFETPEDDDDNLTDEEYYGKYGYSRDSEEPEDDYEWDWYPSCPMDCEICGCHGCGPDVGCDFYNEEYDLASDDEDE